MANKIIIIFLLMCGTAYAEISSMSIDDVKDHSKLQKQLNIIIDKINKDRIDDRNDNKYIKNYVKYQLKVDDKIVKKMISNGWVSTHSEVEPN